MKKAPSTVLATAGIAVGLLGLALPASAAQGPLHQGQHNSKTHGTPSDQNKIKGSKRKQPNCPPPRLTRGQQQHGQHGQQHGQPPQFPAETPNNQKTNTGKTTTFPWQQPTKVIACHPAPAPHHGKGQKNPKAPKGYSPPWSTSNNPNQGHKQP